MPSPNIRRKKNLSPHQKQIRFFTAMGTFIGVLFALGILWLVNRASFFSH